MKFIIYLFLILISLSHVYARDPGTGSNTTVGPGPATPDAGSSDTSIMGGGTPGNQGIDTLDMDEFDEKEMKKIKQEQQKKEEQKSQSEEIE